MITMTQMLTSTRNDSKEEMDGTKCIHHIKKKKKKENQKHPEAASLSLIHACQKHLLLSVAVLSSKSFGSARLLPLYPLVNHKPSPYYLMHNWTKLIVNCS